MVITPKLEYRAKEDGTVRIFIYIYDPLTRTKAKVPTPYFVRRSEWDGSQVTKVNSSFHFINAKVSSLVSDLKNHWLRNPGITPAGLKSFLNHGQVSEFTPEAYFRHYIDLCEKGLILKKGTKEKMSPGYLRAVGTSAAHFEKFGRKVSFNEINEEFFDSYVYFLRYDLNLKQNTIAKSIKHLVMILKHARKKKHHTNDIDYSVKKEKTFKIRLTPAEVDRIVKLNLKDWPELVSEHERFQVAYNLLLRFGDTISINENNIVIKGKKPFLSMHTQKGKKEIMLPIRSDVYQILKKNNFSISAANSTSNEKLKKIGLLAGINEKVVVTEYRSGKKTETVYKKYELLETHTTRRSAARNLYDSGLDPLIIQVLGGWSNLKQMLEYIDINIEYAAGKAADHPFFN